jgi:hypothetical protein
MTCGVTSIAGGSGSRDCGSTIAHASEIWGLPSCFAGLSAVAPARMKGPARLLELYSQKPQSRNACLKTVESILRADKTQSQHGNTSGLQRIASLTRTSGHCLLPRLIRGKARGFVSLVRM